MIEDTLKRIDQLDGDASFWKQYADFMMDFKQLQQQITQSSSDQQKRIRDELTGLVAETVRKGTTYFLLSFFIETWKRIEDVQALLELALADENLSKEQQFFILYQCYRKMFMNPELYVPSTELLMRKLYRRMYRDFRTALCSGYSPIPYAERNHDLVVVMTGQMLSINHGPTKTALDRCYHLMQLGKRVLLINTKEVLSTRSIVPMYQVTLANDIETYESLTTFPYKNVEIPYYQCSAQMPDEREMHQLLDFIAMHKPSFIIGIGALGLTADLASNFVPAVVVPLGMSYSLPITESQFHFIGRALKTSDIELLELLGFGQKNVIQGRFTFDFKPQTHRYTRADFGLPEDEFLIAIVGTRHNDEVTTEFLNMLAATIPVGCHFVFVGPFQLYETLVAAVPLVKDHSTNLGTQDDILAILELCDLYANPKRSGGGTSAVEAMYQGLPVVALPIGDVSENVGETFWVDSYEAMAEMIRKYATDRVFYQNMAQQARERAAELMDTRHEMMKLIQEIDNRSW